MAPTSKQTSKPVFKTSSPYTETRWPEISPSDQEVIVELLCNLVAPLGHHRRTYIHPSKGKKRKRTNISNQDDAAKGDPSPPPPAPEITKHIYVGLNSVTRHLETLAAQNAPSTMPITGICSNAESPCLQTTSQEHQEPGQPVKQSDTAEITTRHLSMVILTHPKPSLSPAHAHIPTLVHISNLSSPLSPTLLVPLPTSTDVRLASALHIPRVGALAVFEGAPGAKALQEYVQQFVGVTECPWIDEAMQGEWKGLNVKIGNVEKQ